MNQFTIDVLKYLAEKSNPYVDISTVQDEYDIYSDNFIAAFRQLESNRFIASANTDRCGLLVSGDGIPNWSVVDLHVTDEGLSFLEPTPKAVGTPIKDWLIKPTIQNVVAWAVIGILAIAVTISWPKIKETIITKEPVAGQSGK
ncbi:hypothetical protein [Teredinibacter turnerae]|uniref:hypothetical protein n=1 Tax=Teredinibacter turnerae TaxID=2426 RepID=UPI00042A2FBB|nr:hypothetical protein [Teredinibacter turnerae]